jgi:mono/diheme cytochrome c family protein
MARGPLLARAMHSRRDMRATVPIALLLLAGCPAARIAGLPTTVEPPTTVNPPPSNIPGVPGIQATFGGTVEPARPVRPLSGGTLLLLRDGRTALAADPDRDRVYLVDLGDAAVITDLALTSGDEPGRSVEDSAGGVHVVLRGGGALLSLRRQGSAFAVSARRPICAEPRGIDYDPATDRLHVACAGGELVSLPAAGGEAVRTVSLPLDLRDVVVSDGVLYVSRFRSADVLRLDPTGTVVQRLSPPRSGSSSPAVAWRMRPVAGGGLVLVHQLDLDGPVQPASGGYGGNNQCERLVTTAVTVFGRDGRAILVQRLPRVALAVDVAVSADGARAAVLAAGNAHLAGAPPFVTFPLPSASPVGTTVDNCGDAATGELPQPAGELVAVAMTAELGVVMQTREPAALILPSGRLVSLSSDSRADTGYTVFHSAANSNTGIACASCHPEGGDDGHVWTFAGLGLRRTQSLRGSPVAPFHWDGALRTFPALVDEVFSTRMSGPRLDSGQQQALARFIATIPGLPRALDGGDAVARGRTLFEDPRIGCASCHGQSGHPMVDVGTGGTFKAPSLAGVRWRAPYLHDGCAPTLAARFGACGGGDRHGFTSGLTPPQIGDLVAYLESL